MCQHNLPCSSVYAHCLLPGRAFASLYVLLFLEKEAEIGGRVLVHLRKTCPEMTEKNVDWDVHFTKESDQTNKNCCLLINIGLDLYQNCLTLDGIPEKLFEIFCLFFFLSERTKKVCQL